MRTLVPMDRRTRSLFRAAAAWLALAVVVACYGLFCGCSGGGPTAPSGERYTMPTAVGRVTVSGPGAVDARGAIEAELAEAARRITVQGYSPDLGGIEVQLVKSGCETRETVLRVGDLACLDHEAQHAAAWHLGRRGDCYVCQDHRGSASGDPDAGWDARCPVGYLLDCSPWRPL